MKRQSKIGSIVLLFALILSLFPAPAAFAVSDADVETYTFTEDLGNDYSVETTVVVHPTQVRSSSKSATATSVFKHAEREIATVSFREPLIKTQEKQGYSQKRGETSGMDPYFG